MKYSLLLGFIGLILLTTQAHAGCYPLPVAGAAVIVVCSLETEGGLEHVCIAENVKVEGPWYDGNYRITGYCDYALGAWEGNSYFEAKATYNKDPPNEAVGTGTAKEAVRVFTDPGRTQEAGKVAGTYRCVRNPFQDQTSPCTPEGGAFSASGLSLLPKNPPFTRGMAISEKVSTAQQGLMEAAKEEVVGVRRGGSEPYYLWRAGSWAAFNEKWKELGKLNLRLVDVETYPLGNQRIYLGVWRGGKDPFYLWQIEGWKAFTDKWAELGKQNLRLVDIETFASGGKRYFLGVWRGGSDPFYLWNVEGWKTFTDKWSELGKQNLRLVDIATYDEGGRRYYVGAWRAGSDAFYLWNVEGWKAFTDKWSELSKKKLRLVDLEAYKSGGKDFYIGVWRGGSDGHYLWSAGTWKDFAGKWEHLGKEPLRLIDLTVQE